MKGSVREEVLGVNVPRAMERLETVILLYSEIGSEMRLWQSDNSVANS